MSDVEVEREVAPKEEAAACPVNSHPCPVVAIGSSAGGLEAFQELFRHMPDDTGLGFVLIQHLSPRHETLIPELLSPLTAMPVRQASVVSGVDRQPDHARAAGALLRQAGQPVSGRPRDPGPVPVLAAQPDRRSAVLAAGPDLLPQPPDLSRGRAAEEGPRPLPLRPASGRLSVARPLGDGFGAARSVPHARQEASDLPVAGYRGAPAVQLPAGGTPAAGSPHGRGCAAPAGSPAAGGGADLRIGAARELCPRLRGRQRVGRGRLLLAPHRSRPRAPPPPTSSRWRARGCVWTCDQATAEQRDRARQTIERQAVHLTRLVDDLLDISRISQGKILLRRERVDLTETVRAVVEDLRPQAEAAGLALELHLSPSRLWVEGDPTRLSQVVGNVLHNAVKFTDRGGRITVAASEDPERGSAAVTVRDTGAGMEPELLGRIFEPFSQAERGADRQRGGLGLGSEITLRLPLASGREETFMAEQTPTEASARALRCLVIEDHEDAAESLALLLRLDGHEADVAFDAAEGLEKARQLHPDVVLCDIGLPGGMDGYDVAKALRADAETRSAHLIALTGYGQDEDRRRALEAGFDAHLTKPADLDMLRRLLATAGR